jgi:hypothetical protein
LALSEPDSPEETTVSNTAAPTAAPHLTAAELLEQALQGERGTVRAAVALAQRDLAGSRNHAARDYDGDVSAVYWFGVIASDLRALPLLARRTAERTGARLTGMESLALAEAEAVITVSGPEQLNSWISAHSHNPPYPDARAACLVLYAIGLGVARAMLGDVLRILERAGA